MPQAALPASAYFDALRFVATPAFFQLNATHPTQAVEILALDDGVAGGSAVGYVTFPLVPALTTAPAWISSVAITPGHLFFSVDTRSAGILLQINCPISSGGADSKSSGSRRLEDVRAGAAARAARGTRQ